MKETRRWIWPLFMTSALLLSGIAAQLFATSATAIDALEARRLAVLEEVRQGRNTAVSYGTLTTLEAYLADAKHVFSRDADYVKRTAATVDEVLSAAERHEDVLSQRRRFFWRGYNSRFSVRPLLYSIYVPDDYDPQTPIPLVVSLHGGSSNHNVWLALNLGNNIATQDYWASFRKPFAARAHPKYIVVSPDGLGQIRWRFSGEQDVFDVMEDVAANYNIDPSRIHLTGLSNGGIGAYTVGLKHAWKFASVLPMAGVTNWLTHHEATARHRPEERVILRNESAITWAENAHNTHLAFFHGVRDSGFKVQQARDLADRLKALDIRHAYSEMAGRGHDIMSVLWRDLKIDKYIRTHVRKEAPERVRLVTASDRAQRQFWLQVDERVSHVDTAHLDGQRVDPHTLRIATSNVARFTVHLDTCPIQSPMRIYVDEQLVYEGDMPQSASVVFNSRFVPTFAPLVPGAATPLRPAPLWRQWDNVLPTPGTVKVSRLSGPLHDAQYEAQVHVYGTLAPDETDDLMKAAYRGARGWVMAQDYTDIRFPVIADKDLSWDLIANRVLVLYGNAANNAVLKGIGEKLPIQVGNNEIRMRGKKVAGQHVGARFICPNPLMPNRYLVVVAGATPKAVLDSINLPIYLADYIVYNAQTVQKKAFMVLGGRPEIETGFFTQDWQLPAAP
ncbi:MAG: prolyl oligopeptidase family serine peptidase [Proteobacteria bacterium]|nr:prolyl oligopeptidase family serine peptidase [Pseudomonadota bacterium]